MYYFQMNNLSLKKYLRYSSAPNCKWGQKNYTRITFKHIATNMQMWKHES